jgi:glycosyltransferase involved in cell wall biosynthesis
MKRICMITHSFYECDSRVRRYAESLAERGDSLDVIALRSGPDVPREEVIKGVTVLRIQDRFGVPKKSIIAYLWPLLRFLFVSSWRLNRLNWRKQFDLIHVHNIPDFLVFAAWGPKLQGAKVILDIHDVMPELCISKFSRSESSQYVRSVKVVERISAAFAHHVILPNHLWLEKYAARSAKASKCSVFINNVDERIFKSRPALPKNDKRIAMFPGSLQWHQGLDIAIRAFERVRTQVPNAEFHIYGDGDMKPRLMELVNELGLSETVRFFNPVSLEEIAVLMANADLGVIPKRADAFGNEAYSTKIMEFMAVGVPTVVSDTKVDRFYFDESIVRFFKSGNADQLAEVILNMFTNDTERRGLVARASAYVELNNWKSRENDYFNLVDSLCLRNEAGHGRNNLLVSLVTTCVLIAN